MSSLAWLPPLNSHEDYVIATRFEEAQDVLHMVGEDAELEPETGTYSIWIHVKVSVRFFDEQNRKASQTFNGKSNNKTGGFLGLSLNGICKVTYAEPEARECPCIFFEQTTTSILTDLNIPFELYPIHFLENNRVRRLGKHNFLHRIWSVVSSAALSSTSNIIPVRWLIFKHVILSDDEYKAWTSWYNEKIRADPGFQDEYLQAITRPRTTEELLYQELVKFSAATASSIQGLEVVKGKDLDSQRNCLVCLEDISVESQAIRLPCSHVFHGECIVKWLEKSHMCPLCRFTLPTSVKE